MLMDKLKDIIVIVASTLLGFFAPISDFIVAILILMAVNFVSGLLEDELNGTGWKRKKAFKAFTELFVLTGIGAFVYAVFTDGSKATKTLYTYELSSEVK